MLLVDLANNTVHHTSVFFWNKEGLGPKQGKYKQFKLAINSLGQISFKPYYVATLEMYLQQYELYIPVYEIEAFKDLTGLQETEDSE